MQSFRGKKTVILKEVVLVISVLRLDDNVKCFAQKLLSAMFFAPNML